MSTYEKFSLLLQATGFITLFITLIIYHQQLRTMGKQLKVSSSSVIAQNILTLTAFLQNPESRNARAHILVKLRDKNFAEWSEDDHRNASNVCATYDTVALIIKMGLVPSEPFITNWAASIKNCFEVTKPLIEKMQKHKNSGPYYWENFCWLYNKTKNNIKTHESGHDFSSIFLDHT